MPRLTIVAVRASLIYLAFGFTYGALLLANKGPSIDPALWGLLGTHIELLTLGWMAQLAMGVGYWILPRFAGERGNVRLAWISIGLLNGGLLLAALGPILVLPEWPLLVGRAAEALAIGAFGWHAWPRIKAPGV